MPSPPRSIKVTKNGVEYLNNVDRVNYTLQELKMGALRDAGKYLAAEAKKRVPVFTGTLRKNISAFARKKTGDLQVGVYKRNVAKKKGLKSANHAHLVEFGTVKMAARPYLRPAVEENIDTIRKIEAQYLSALSDENTAFGMIDDSWEEVETGDE